MMGTKKKKIKLSARRRRQLKSFTPFLLAGIIGFIVGTLGLRILAGFNKPSNLVWAADSTVAMPKGLEDFLESQNGCKEYRGTGTPTGLGLWGVYQTSKGKFAKIAYGCSWNLVSYIMAVKQSGKWQLLQPKEYFASVRDGADPVVGGLPRCTVIEKYKIDKNIEPFCIASDGTAKPNNQP